MDSKLSLLLLWSLAGLCIGQMQREAIDLSSNTSGVIEFEGNHFKTWHFLSSGGSINGTLNFTYIDISDYFWRLSTDDDREQTLSSISITDVTPPLWLYEERNQPRIVRISNNFAVVMTYNGETEKIYAPKIKIGYRFQSFDTDGNPSTEPEEATSQKPTTTATGQSTTDDDAPAKTETPSDDENAEGIIKVASSNLIIGGSIACGLLLIHVGVCIKCCSKNKELKTKIKILESNNSGNHQGQVEYVHVEERVIQIDAEYATVQKPSVRQAETKVNEVYDMGADVPPPSNEQP